MSKSIKIQIKGKKFKLRVAGVIKENDKILFVGTDNSDVLSLPGGYLELGESSEEGLIRELKEETTKNFEIKEYLGVMENYFQNKKQEKVHEISFYYRVKSLEQLPDHDFTLIENDKGRYIRLNFKWISLSDLKKYRIEPQILQRILLQENTIFNHLITK